ncbi:hypothetical protein EMIT047CA2_50297 [Pseudomonas soli]
MKHVIFMSALECLRIINPDYI